MIVTLKSAADREAVRGALAARGLWVSAVETTAAGSTLLVVAPHSTAVAPEELERIEGVAAVAVPESEHPRIDGRGPTVEVAGVRFGGGKPVFLCGPCSVESEEGIVAIARRLAAAGVEFLRGGAFKPRTSPYAFQGHGDPALGWLRRAASLTGMKVVTEALSEGHVERVAEHADLVQIGSRNMQNYALLKAVGRTRRPVLLKRAFAATVDEWLLAAEYLLVHGAADVILCERGVRSFDPATRNLLDLGAVALLAHVHRLPVIVDPSHASGRRDLVVPLARAGLAAGAAGVMIEVHDQPGCAKSDGPQALSTAELAAALPALRRLGAEPETTAREVRP
jgi:3-deoxy-7-phosphoheptulonate synthase